MTVARDRTILLTGATTPVGRALVAALQRDPRVRALLCVYGPNEREPGERLDLVQFERADLTSRRGLRDLLLGEPGRRVDTIVHAPLQRDPLAQGEQVQRLNVESTRHLLLLAEEVRSVRRFVLQSTASVYRIDSDEPVLIDEDHPLDLSPHAPAGVRSRVEADVTVAARIGSSRLQIAIVRCAEILAPASGSQLHDYLSSRVCLRPLGYDPMVNVLSLPDAARALALATISDATGIFNVPGGDSLPLSELIHRSGRFGVALPDPLLGPLYRLRSALTSGRFSYALDRPRFHYGALLDGRKAQQALRYVPESRVDLGTLFGAR